MWYDLNKIEFNKINHFKTWYSKKNYALQNKKDFDI